VKFVQDLPAYYDTMEMYSAPSTVLGMAAHSQTEATPLPAYHNTGSGEADILSAPTMRRTGLPRGPMESGPSIMTLPGNTFQMFRDAHPKLLDQFLYVRGRICALDGTTNAATPPRHSIPGGGTFISRRTFTSRRRYDSPNSGSISFTGHPEWPR
jgi:hypothetical protein